MQKLTRSPVHALAVLAAIVGIACSDTPEGPIATSSSPLAGLLKGLANDSAPTAPGSSTLGSGAIHGTVRGQSAPGSGPDTMATAARVSGVKVTAYKLVLEGTTPTAGAQVAATTTDSTGAFALPSLPGGNYVVTFVPPNDSKYRGQYVFGPVNSETDRFPWYIVLSNR